MRIATVIIFAVLIAGCSSKPAPETGAAVPASPAPAPQAPAIIELDETARRDSNLRVVTVEPRSIPESVRANGRMTTNENTTWRVGAITDGRIIRVEVKVGDRVEKGQVLARMHSHDIHESRAAFRRAEAEVNRLRGHVEFARRTRDRVRRLFEMKAASLEQVDQAENALKNEQVALSSAEIEMNRTRIHLVDFLEIPVQGPEDPAHDKISGTEIDDLIPVRAPASGVVLTREITPGAVVSASSDLFTICDLSSIWAIAAVQEEHLSRLRTGMAGHVHVQAYPERTFSGKVTRIDSKLDPETRTVSVRVEINNSGGLLKPEMYATVDLDAGGSAPALFVPQEALQDVNGQGTVFVELEPGRYQPRAVETGRLLDGQLQVMRGLKSGEKVVAGGSFILKSQLLKSSLGEE